MNRTIKFRGKSIKTGQWLFGSFFDSIWEKNDGSPVCYIFPDDMLEPDGDCWEDFACVAEDYEVDPETVGQFTGLLDKNGREIYEGDVLLFGSNKTPNKCEVGWNNAFTSFCVRLSYEKRFGIKPLGEWLFVEPMEVIGNIYDIPELLNEK